MMIFNPDAGLSFKELYERKWEHEWSDSLKAEILAVADAQGCSWYEVVLQCAEVVLEDLEDPLERARMNAKWEAENMPFGPDPQVGTGGSHDLR